MPATRRTVKRSMPAADKDGKGFSANEQGSRLVTPPSDTKVETRGKPSVKSELVEPGGEAIKDVKTGSAAGTIAVKAREKNLSEQEEKGDINRKREPDSEGVLRETSPTRKVNQAKETGHKRKSMDVKAVSELKKSRQQKESKQSAGKGPEDSVCSDLKWLPAVNFQKKAQKRIGAITGKKLKEKLPVAKKKDFVSRKNKNISQHTSSKKRQRAVVIGQLTSDTAAIINSTNESYDIYTEKSSSSGSDFEEVPSQHVFKTPESTFKDRFSPNSLNSSKIKSPRIMTSSASTFSESGYSRSHTDTTYSETNFDGADGSSHSFQTGSSLSFSSCSCGDSCDCSQSCSCGDSCGSSQTCSCGGSCGSSQSCSCKGSCSLCSLSYSSLSSPPPLARTRKKMSGKVGFLKRKIASCDGIPLQAKVPSKTLSMSDSASKASQRTSKNFEKGGSVKRKVAKHDSEHQMAGKDKHHKEKPKKVSVGDRREVAKRDSSSAVYKTAIEIKKEHTNKVSTAMDTNDVMAVLLRMEGQMQQSDSSSTRVQTGKPHRALSSEPGSSDKKGSGRKRATKRTAATHPESSEDSEWEEVEDLHHSTVKSQIPDGPVEITINDPGIMHRKKKKDFDWHAYVQRKILRRARELQIDMHKVNLLCLLSHGMLQNAECNDETLCAMALSVIPSSQLQRPLKDYDSQALLQIMRWCKQKIHLSDGWQETRSLVSASQLRKVITTFTATEKRIFVMAFVSLLRSMGLTVRLVMSVHPLPIKNTQATAPTSSQKRSQPGKKKDQKNQNPAKQTNSRKTPKVGLAKTIKGRPSGSKKKGDSSTNDDSAYEDARPKKRVSSRIKKTTVNTAAEFDDDCGEELMNNFDSNFLEEEEFVKQGDKQHKRAVKMSKRNYNNNTEQQPDAKYGQKSLKMTEAELKRKKPNQKILSSDDESPRQLSEQKEKQGQDYWLEVFLPEEDKWCCLDFIKGTVNKFYDISDAASQPLLYALGFDNEGRVKDVTAKYAPKWLSHTRKQRVDPNWWMATLEPYSSYNVWLEDEENEHIKENLMKRPLPTSIAEYKNHPLYALGRHLLKYEAIYPENSIPIGYIRHEPVYARECVHTLHSRDNWLREARVVRIGETAYKMVKSRKKWNRMKENSEELDLELFGHWQTEEFIPPIAVNGKVPKNEYGNVELFKPSMLPRGTVHLKVPALNRVAKKLDIDVAPAMTGWDHHSGFSHPVLDGWIVCEEHKEILLAAWKEDQEIQKQREIERRKKRVLDNWTSLVRGLLIKEKLKKKFNLEEKGEQEVKRKKAKKGAAATDMEHAWPAKQQQKKKSQKQPPQPSHYTVETM